ncbi:UNVERIFIED_CONTAM: G patch domain-containing protein 4 [Siphonaria sp. JEL0065]|nr:G patch domain-containing protein 4 [Siphonaria sp. JEL0065]
MSFGGIGTGSSFGNNVAHAWATGDFGNEDLVSSSVAASHLTKLGWKHGEGLGKKKDGINRAISVGFKNDTKGIGSASNEFGFSWWDHVFNKASSQIKIHKEDDGEIQVKVEKNSAKAKQLLYGSFTTGGEQHDDDKDYSIKVTDEELFIACEGRTARKGARAEQPGKLKRAVKKVDEIEIITIEESSSITTTITSSDKKEKKKDKKRKHATVEEAQLVKTSMKRTKVEDVDGEEVFKKEKKRKEKKRVGDSVEEETPKKQKKSKKIKTQPAEDEETEQPKKKKKFSRDSITEDAASETIKKKKKKKASKSSDE